MQKGKIVQGLFNTQDEKLHRAMKKPIAGIYSMSNLVGFEQYVDSTIDYFFRRLEEAHDNGLLSTSWVKSPSANDLDF
jgi:hypothetical protein